jgi:hypothetical protein
MALAAPGVVDETVSCISRPSNMNLTKYVGMAGLLVPD